MLVDDSIVRGTTSGRIVRLLREAGALEVHMRVSAPQLLYPCYYGTDIDSKENLIACKMDNNEIARHIERIHWDISRYMPLTFCQKAEGAARPALTVAIQQKHFRIWEEIDLKDIFQISKSKR